MTKVGLFVESFSAGGLRTFIKNFIISSNSKTKITFICNYELKKNKDFNKIFSKRGNVKVIYYKILSIERISKKRNKILKLFYGIIFPLIFLNQILKLNKIFKKINMDNLMVVNGGYPGSELCNAACISYNNLNPKNKIFINFHNFVLRKNKDLLLNFYHNLVDLYLSKLPINFISVSKICSRSLKFRKYLNKKKVKTIYNGFTELSVISNKKISLRKKYKLKKSNKILLMLAEYVDRKGFDFIFRVMQKLRYESPNFKLIIFGHGDIERYRKKIIKYKLSNFVFLNSYFSNNLTIIKQCDYLVIPSQRDESFGFTAIEAMSQKKIIIACKTGGLSEVIKNNFSGFLIAHTNHTKFAKKIIKINENNELKKKMKKNAYLRYKSYFKASIMFKNYFNFFQR